jgi:hypothetical protein
LGAGKADDGIHRQEVRRIDGGVSRVR